jgi:hypothetical protein
MKNHKNPQKTCLNDNIDKKKIVHKNHKHVLLVAMCKIANLICIVHELVSSNFVAYETFCLIPWNLQVFNLRFDD